MQESINDTIIVIARKHWITYVSFLVWHAIIFCVIVLGISVAHNQYVSLVGLSCAWLLATSALWFFVTQYLDRWVITEEEILAVDQIELFNRAEAHILMNRIQDVKWEKHGILQEMLGYGRLTVQDAGIEREFILENVAGVERVAELIVSKKKVSSV